MVTKKVDISIQNLSKIEGHANLDVKVRNGKVSEVHIAFTDNKRFFTQAIRGQSIDTLPQAVSRICGTCSIAHMMGCIKAIEYGLGVRVSEQTKKLQLLTEYGMMIRDHALHVYLFSLPDVFGKDSVLDFEGTETQYLKDSFVIKRAGNKLNSVVAGKAVHAPYPQVGGFSVIPDNAELKALVPELLEARKKTFDVIEVYAKANVDYTRKTNFAALVGREFNFLDGPVRTSSGLEFGQERYFEYLDKHVLPYSQAIGYTFKGETYMVGALARLNLNKQALHPKTKKDCAKYLKLFPTNNIFHNNLAQAIEIVHCIDHALDIISTTTFKEEKAPELVYKDCEGISVTEAPRGILFYRLSMKKDGTFKEGNIITPTQQNQVNMELDIKDLVQREIDRGTAKEAIGLEMEKLIRSYDPCISCATHFLKVNWDEA